MTESEHLIHDICLFQNRIDFYNRHKPCLVDEITKLKVRQVKVISEYLVLEMRHAYDAGVCSGIAAAGGMAVHPIMTFGEWRSEKSQHQR
jgi:hypothetical protein